MAYFVPLLIGHGGNCGSQSVTTVIRALALKHIDQRSIKETMHTLGKETGVGFFVGLVLAVFVYLMTFVWTAISVDSAIIVGITLPLISMWANLLGAFLPILTTSMGLDASIVSAPLMTTIVDSSGLIIYFAIARTFKTAGSLSAVLQYSDAEEGPSYDDSSH